jgi:hypothetical protein
MKPLLVLMFFIASVVSLPAMGVALTLNYALQNADAIVHCRIDEVGPLADAAPYSKIARATVVSSSKGPVKGELLTLVFDNGLGCPNVTYTKGEEVVVFAKKNADGAYETMNLYCGRFEVVDGVVKSFYLFSGFPPKSEDFSVEDVLTRIREEIQKNEK